MSACWQLVRIEVFAQSYDVLRGARRALGPDGIITAPGDALNVFEFEPAAKKALLSQGAPAHWGYLESGVDGDVTRDANHTAYAALQHPRAASDRRAQGRYQREYLR